MSANAKGKQRAMPDDEPDSSTHETDTGSGMEFSVRFTDGSVDLHQLWVGEREAVREVKRRVR
jgi:hypothetical protein